MGLLQVAASGLSQLPGAAAELCRPTGRALTAGELSYAQLDPPPPTHSIVMSLGMINPQDVTLQSEEAEDLSTYRESHCDILERIQDGGVYSNPVTKTYN